MKLNELEIKKIEHLADAWQVTMPNERFFINLPTKVMEQARNEPRPWWLRLALPAGAAALMAVMILAGISIAGREAVNLKSLSNASIEWGADEQNWENLDRVLSEAQEVGVSGLHRYIKNDGLESVASALDRYSSEEKSLILASGQ